MTPERAIVLVLVLGLVGALAVTVLILRTLPAPRTTRFLAWLRAPRVDGRPGAPRAVGRWAPKPAAAAPGVSVPVVVTHAMRAELSTLGWTPTEIDRMPPARAHEILKRQHRADGLR